MNQNSHKKNKNIKCPSTFPEDKSKVIELSKKCILNEQVSERIELKNGLVNGVVRKHNRKSKRKKPAPKTINGEPVTENECNSRVNCLEETEQDDVVNQSSQTEEKLDENIVNTVHNKDKGTKKKRNKTKTSTGPSTDLEPKISDVSSPHSDLQLISYKDVPQDLSLPSSSTTEPEIKEHSDEDLVKLTEALDKAKIEANASEVVSLEPKPKIDFIQYENELQMPMIMKIIQKDLSEPYSIYTYRYFIHNWPKLCFLAMCGEECVGAIVCKLDLHRKVIKRGYIAMLAVDEKYRKLRIGSNLVQMAINEMILGDADEVVLETEVTNKPALQLYEKLGFVRDKRLFRYYLNGVDALRLKLWLR